MIKKKVLIADDEPLIRDFLKDTLSRSQYDIALAKNGLQAIQMLSQDSFDFVITDMKMPGKTGLDVLQYSKEKDPQSIVIIMTAFASIENAVEAMQKGAFNYLLKPFSADAIETILKKAEEYLVLVKENMYLKKQARSSFICIAHSPEMHRILSDVKKVAQSNASIFISGESGTGKEVIAQAIHYHSMRKDKPFIKVNCAAITETLLESEFFGHEKGAFTGANEKKEGRFEIAHGGTLLLDEITEIPLSLQPKLLRAIQEQEFERVGGTKPLHVNIRFISTTNRHIEDAIKNKLLREDLYYRLNVVPIHIPPLRERKEDIVALCKHFLTVFCQENHKKMKTFSTQALEAMANYPWPGNVRELANIIERTVVMHYGSIIEKDEIFIKNYSSPTKKFLPYHLFEETGYSLPVGISLAELEKRLILETLKAHNHNKTHTAKILGINIRTLRNKLKEYKKTIISTQ